MSKPQKRYSCELDVLAEMNHAKRKITALNREADELEIDGHHQVRTGNSVLVDLGRGKLSAAEHIRKVVVPRLEAKVARLKQAMGAMKTELLPGMGDDKSVVIPKT